MTRTRHQESQKQLQILTSHRTNSLLVQNYLSTSVLVDGNSGDGTVLMLCLVQDLVTDGSGVRSMKLKEWKEKSSLWTSRATEGCRAVRARAFSAFMTHPQNVQT